MPTNKIVGTVPNAERNKIPSVNYAVEEKAKRDHEMAKKSAPKRGFVDSWLLCCLGERAMPKRGKNFHRSGSMRLSRTWSMRQKGLSGAFCEHTWDIVQLQENFPNSSVDAADVRRSRGIATEKAQLFLLRNGPNVLPAPKEMSSVELLIRQFWNLLWALLIGAATLSLLQFFLDTSEMINLYITLILYGMITVMCVLSWFEELRAKKVSKIKNKNKIVFNIFLLFSVVRGFQKLLPSSCVVIRDGMERNIETQQLVVGDIIRIRAGNRVPADCRILHCSELKLESSSITGESEPIEYQAEEVAESVSVFEARNVAFNGSLCVEGDAIAIVIRVAAQTVIGQIAHLTTGQQSNESRLEMQIRKYVKFLIVLACGTAFVVFVAGGFVRRWANVVQLLSNGFLVCAIGMVPCGLPATVTSILTVIARRLASRNVYVKRLDICEALGQVAIIASDKTGTLTKNEMHVTALWHCNKFIKGSPEKINKELSANSSPIGVILECMAVCNSASLNAITTKQAAAGRIASDADRPDEDDVELGAAPDGNKFSVAQKFSRSISMIGGTIHRQDTATGRAKRKAMGSPSEAAMLNYVNQLIDVEETRAKNNVVFEVPFNSKRKWHLVILEQFEDKADGMKQYKMLMKGASEILSHMCSTFVDEHGHQQKLGNVELKQFEDAYTYFAEGGHRVIGFATKTFSAPRGTIFDMEEGNVPLEDLTFLGMCSIMDPPRDDTLEAIKQCKQAGIKVFMVTGDHQLTATAIARQIGLIDNNRKSATEQSNGQVLPKVLKKSQTFASHQQLALCVPKLMMKTLSSELPLSEAEKDFEVVHGERISRLSPSEWDALIEKESVVFARTTPEQKLMIVEQCQRRGKLIAMTGDGVNDAPALKRADIGISMGSGSEVAKQAADIVLVDDNFSSIVHAVEEGRVMFENIKKLLAYTMPHSFPEVWPVIINFCFGFPPGITALQILSIDLCTEILPGVSLSRELAEGDVMARPPRAMNKVLISNTLLAYSYAYTGQIQSLGCFLAYCCVFWYHGIAISDLWMSALTSWKPDGVAFASNGKSFSVEQQLYIGRQACSAWQMGIVFGQFFNIWSARTRRVSLFRHGFLSNKALLLALLVELALIISFVYMPGLNSFLGGAPIPWHCWAVVAAVGIFINAYNEIRKYFVRNYPQNRIVRCFKW
ncbi:hypothetical protein niasHT_020801 [Heterodera trifolii]|uniref:Cation-transporting P-type ATPase N-terminal domain-containing protein n=1 Tax=Heterodera trifolii TaxID=157864 RepID=A0ABD2KEX2_9BILA